MKNNELYWILLSCFTSTGRESVKFPIISFQRLNDAGAELWHEEIQQCIDKANGIAEDGERCKSFWNNSNLSITARMFSDVRCKLMIFLNRFFHFVKLACGVLKSPLYMSLQEIFCYVLLENDDYLLSRMLSDSRPLLKFKDTPCHH